MSGCQLNAPVQNLILPLAACERLGTIKAANCGLTGKLPSLDPMPPTKVDREVRLGTRSYLAKSLETLDLSGGGRSWSFKGSGFPSGRGMPLFLKSDVNLVLPKIS